MYKRLAVVLLALLMVLAVPALALADDGADGRFVMGGSFTLRSGERLIGDLVVMGGTARLEADSLVTGNVVVMGGALSVAGQVAQDVTLIGGSAQLESTAVIMGQVISVGGSLTRQPGAQVRGEIVEGLRDVPLPFVWRAPMARATRPLDWSIRLFSNVMGAILSTLAIMALALLAVLLLPDQTEQVTKVLVAEPVLSLGTGLLTMLVMPILLILLVITCIGPLLLGLAFGIAVFFGWIAAGLYLGRRLLEAAKAQEPTALVEVLVGVAVITLLSRVPCVGWLFGLGVAAIGLGAVLLSRFGTSTYPWPSMEDVDASASGGLPRSSEDDVVAAGGTSLLEAGEEGMELDGPAEDLDTLDE